MKDRLEFQKTVLSNGITIWSQYQDIPFVLSRIIFPFGHAHNTGEILPGSFHFLEHMLNRRSKIYPGKNEWKKMVARYGGSTNANTRDFQTTYLLNSTTDRFEIDFAGQIAQVFFPYINADDVDKEKNVIRNERDRCGFWFPSNSERGQYLYTKWIDYGGCSLSQTFGDDQSLAQIDTNYFEGLHRLYLHPEVQVVVIGNFKIENLVKHLEQIPTKETVLPISHKKTSWVNREFHCKEISGGDMFEYRMCGIHDSDQFKSLTSSNFIGYLSNSVDGVLFDKLRTELGIVYSVGNISRSDSSTSLFGLKIDLQNLTLVNNVRGMILDLIETSLKDEAKIKSYVERKLARSAFWYSSPEEIIDEVCTRIYNKNPILSEAEMARDLSQSVTKEKFQALFDEYFHGDLMGECLLAPIVK